MKLDRFEIVDWAATWTTKTIGGENLRRVGLIPIVFIIGLWLRIEEKVWSLRIKNSWIRLGIYG